MQPDTIFLLTAVVIVELYVEAVIMVNKRTCLAKFICIEPETDENINKMIALAEAIFTNVSIVFAPEYEVFKDLSIHIVRKNDGTISEVTVDSLKSCIKFNGDPSKTIVNKKQFSKTGATLFVFGTMCSIAIVFIIFFFIATGK